MMRRDEEYNGERVRRIKVPGRRARKCRPHWSGKRQRRRRISLKIISIIICSHRETQLKFEVFLTGRAPINRQKIPMLVAFKALTTYFQSAGWRRRPVSSRFGRQKSVNYKEGSWIWAHHSL